MNFNSCALGLASDWVSRVDDKKSKNCSSSNHSFTENLHKNVRQKVFFLIDGVSFPAGEVQIVENDAKNIYVLSSV